MDVYLSPSKVSIAFWSFRYWKKIVKKPPTSGIVVRFVWITFPYISGWWFQAFWKIWKSIGMMTFPIYGKITFMFQTTNQISYQDPACRCDSAPPWGQWGQGRLWRRATMTSWGLWRCNGRETCGRCISIPIDYLWIYTYSSLNPIHSSNYINWCTTQTVWVIRICWYSCNFILWISYIHVVGSKWNGPNWRADRRAHRVFFNWKPTTVESIMWDI